MLDNKNFFYKEENAMIDTPQELIEHTILKVESYLKESFPEYISFDNGSFTVARGKSQVMIIIRPFTENDTCVEVINNVVSGANITPELMRFLLNKNAEIHFGAFGLLFDNTITFQHSIAGANLDKNELLTSLNAVAIIANHYAEEIVKMAGGTLSENNTSEELE